MAAAVLFLACAEQGNDIPAGETAALTDSAVNIPIRNEPPFTDAGNISVLLEEIAELERAGAYQRGMGFVESEMKEKTGDYAGAVVAAFKEMARLYGFGEIQRYDLEQGLDRAIALEGQDERDLAVPAALALQAFLEKRWDDAEKMLAGIFPEIEELDDFINWMLLSCAIEKDPGDRKAASVYKAIRARYTQFPEYWYRGAKIFKGSIASDYAEKCINLAPEGPFARECRNILGSLSGLRTEDSAALKSKWEIESRIIQAVNSGNPVLLEQLMPLIALPENPYTLYALGALKALASIPIYREYFETLAVTSNGRLADRLIYLCRS